MNLSGSGRMHSGPTQIVCMQIQICTLYTANLCVFSFLKRSLRSESVAAEGLLHRRVRQHHVGVTEHAQTVQAEGLDAQLVLQREASLRVKTFRHRGERTADVLGQTGVGVISEDDVGQTSAAVGVQHVGPHVHRVLQAAVAASQPRQSSLGVVERGGRGGGRRIEAGPPCCGAHCVFQQAELIQLIGKGFGLAIRILWLHKGVAEECCHVVVLARVEVQRDAVKRGNGLLLLLLRLLALSALVHCMLGLLVERIGRGWLPWHVAGIQSNSLCDGGQ